MNYLADVNVLIALAHGGHAFHARVRLWYLGLNAGDRLFTCATTELGLVRALLNLRLVPDVAGAVMVVSSVKQSGQVPFEFLADDVGVEVMPAYVKTARQTTDGHLLMLAAKHEARFATLDTGIPGAWLIP